MKIKKQADGKYYEKIITWKEKPQYGGIFVFSIVFIGIILTIILLIYEKGWKIFGYSLLYLFLFVVLIFSIYIVIILMGEGKKVKFKRINS